MSKRTIPVHVTIPLHSHVAGVKTLHTKGNCAYAVKEGELPYYCYPYERLTFWPIEMQCWINSPVISYDRCEHAPLPPHPCPLLQELDNDSDTLCSCCAKCTRECAEDI